MLCGEGRREGVPAGTQAGRHISAHMPPSAGKLPGAAACSRGQPGATRHEAQAGALAAVGEGQAAEHLNQQAPGPRNLTEP